MSVTGLKPQSLEGVMLKRVNLHMPDFPSIRKLPHLPIMTELWYFSVINHLLEVCAENRINGYD